jgi:hypothetical protein
VSVNPIPTFRCVFASGKVITIAACDIEQARYIAERAQMTIFGERQPAYSIVPKGHNTWTIGEE